MRTTMTAVIAALMFLGNNSPAAHAEPSTLDETCGALHLGMTPDQIIAGRQRYGVPYWIAQRETVWPILQGDCDPD